jgi:hypothetical protein
MDHGRYKLIFLFAVAPLAARNTDRIANFV